MDAGKPFPTSADVGLNFLPNILNNLWDNITGTGMCAIDSLATGGAHKGMEELMSGQLPTASSRLWYTLTDKRFTAWGKFSKVLVPQLAERIAPYVEGASDALTPLVLYNIEQDFENCTSELPSVIPKSY
jgi:hypothetical protein